MVTQSFTRPFPRCLFHLRLISSFIFLFLSISALASTEADKDRDHGPQATRPCPRFLTFDKFNPFVRLFREYAGPSALAADDFNLLWQLSGDVSKVLLGSEQKRGEFNEQRILELVDMGNQYLGRAQNRRIFVQSDSREWAINTLNQHFPKWMLSPELIAVEITDAPVLLFDKNTRFPFIIPRGSLVVMSGNFPVKIFYTHDHFMGD